MPMWISITVGAGSLLGLFALTGFALARVLGTVSREISEIYANDFVDDPAADSYPLAKRGAATAGRAPAPRSSTVIP
jgi:hypothetical protein